MLKCAYFGLTLHYSQVADLLVLTGRQNPSRMLKNNIKIAIRALLRQKVYAFINLAGLAVGIASCLLIAMFVQNEFSYDRFFQNGDQINKLVLERIYSDHSTYYSIIPHSFANVAVTDYAEIESSTIITGHFGNSKISYKNEQDVKQEFEENLVLTCSTPWRISTRRDSGRTLLNYS